MANVRPWQPVGDGVTVDLKVAPGAKADRIDGVELQDDGAALLRVRVQAPPAGGKANRAVRTLLAKRLGLAKSDLTLAAGAAGRRKRLHLAADPDRLVARLEAEL